MQSSKSSKKTRKIAEETPAPVLEPKAATEATSKPRSTKSSAPKKEGVESRPAKSHRKLSPPKIIESVAAIAAEPVAVKEKAMTVAVGSDAVHSATIDPVGIVTSSVSASELTENEPFTPTASSIGHDEIARLAHSYWIARGYKHGSAEEDWLRAERELLAKR